MTHSSTSPAEHGRYVHANGIDIFYREMGAGEPLLLLHGGTASGSEVWAGHDWGWASHMPIFAEHFRVIAPDTRGHGRTFNPSNEMSYQTFADDMRGVIDALGLDHPLACGFSDGGIIATLVELRQPGTLRALVNYAGFDVFGPNPPYTPRVRKGWGGSPDAMRADPEHMERRFGGKDWFELLKRDLEAAQGPGAWQAHVEAVFRLWTTPLGYTFNDLRAVAVPTLVLVGDRDRACTVEDAVTTYRALPEAELCVLPHLHHAIAPQSRDIAIEFLLRHHTGEPTPGQA